MKELEVEILQHLKERRWDNLRPGDIAKSIMIEGAELLELFQWSNASLEEVRQDAAKLELIKKEIADVLIYAIEMTTLLGIDTEAVIRSKLAQVAKKYPAELMSARPKEESEAGSEYWKIKQEYRKRDAEVLG